MSDDRPTSDLRQQLQDIWMSTSGVRLDGPEIDQTIALIESEALQILDRLTMQATETKDVKTGAIRQTVGLGYILNERRNLAQRQAELEAGSGEAADA